MTDAALQLISMSLLGALFELVGVHVLDYGGDQRVVLIQVLQEKALRGRWLQVDSLRAISGVYLLDFLRCDYLLLLLQLWRGLPLLLRLCVWLTLRRRLSRC